MKLTTLGRAAAVGMSLALLWSAVAVAAVWTDQADYSPGSVVTISGDNSNDAGYLAGETIDVAVSGPNGWSASCSGVADEFGAWSCQVTLDPDPAVAVGDYSYTAVGQESGISEGGAFSDGNIQVKLSGGPTSASIHYDKDTSSTTCAATQSSGNITVNNSAFTTIVGTGSGQSAAITAPVISGYTFSGWSGDITSTDNPLCVSVPTGNGQILANYTPAPTNHTPVVTANNQNFNEGTSTSYSASWTDTLDPAQTHTCTINFGDGSGAQAGTISPAQPSTSGTCSLNHTYADGPNSYTITVSVSDGTATGSNTATATVLNVKPTPSIDTLTGNSGAACIGGNEVSLDFSWTDPAGTNDTYSYDVAWGDGAHTKNANFPTADLLYSASPVTGLTHTYAAGGPYTIVVTVNDEDTGAGNSTSSAPFSFLYNTTGLLQPISNTQAGALPTLFKYGSTIPVKLIVTDCDGTPVAGLELYVKVKKLAGTTPEGSPEDGVSSGSANSGNMLRDAGDGMYIFNMSTKVWTSDPTAEYMITVYDDAIAPVSANVGLRK